MMARDASTSPQLLTPDLCVIGAGAAGLSVAATAAALGVPTVLIERGRMGGDCLNFGCVPSKALIAAASRAANAREHPRFGVAASTGAVDFERVKAHIRGTIADIAPNDSVARYRAMGVRVIEAEACFVDGRTVAAGEYRIKARRFVVATGGKAAVPPIDGLETIQFHTNESIFDLPELPKHLLIVGGGPIGCELAQAFRRLGAEVTIVEGLRALGREDPEASGIALAALAADGVRIEEGVEIRNAARAGEDIMVRGRRAGEDLAFIGSHLLLAVGRRPVFDGLGLEAAGIAFDPRKGIVVDHRLKTSNRRVYAIGDCTTGATQGLQFTHAANYHAGLVIRNAIFRLPVRIDPLAIPRVTFTDPEIAAIGMTEAQAREAGHAIRLLRFPFAENDRAIASGNTAGFVKIVADRKGRLLGATIVGHEAGEQIPLFGLMLARKIGVDALRDLVFAYPTLSETARRAALGYYAASAGNPWLHRLIRFLRWFG
jgi:pyruvate/2-oxoglutarate dehydrogenase complex dihydrolipoamide dehydrogenase (E3) component